MAKQKASVDELIITVGSGPLKEALRLVGKVVPEKGIMPALESVLLVADTGIMLLTGSDLTYGITTSVEVFVDEPVRICIPHKTLFDIVSALPDQPVRIRYDEETLLTYIDSSTGTAKMQGIDPSLYPPIEDKSQRDAITYELEQTERLAFVHYLSRLVVAVKKEEKMGSLRPSMEGVCWSGSMMCGTDGFRILVAGKVFDAGTMKIDNELRPVEYIIPPIGVHAIIDLSKAMDITLGMQIVATDRRLTVHIGRSSVSTRLIDENFPPFRMLNFGTPKTIISTDRLQMIASVKRMLIVADDLGGFPFLVQIQAGGSTATERHIRLYAESSGVNQEADEFLPASTEGERVHFGVNGKLLLSILNALEGEEVTINVVDAMRHIQFMGEDKTLDAKLGPMQLPGTL